VLDATFDAGLSSPGRLHDLFVSIEAVTPGEFKQAGEGLAIRYGFHPTPFGECLLAVTERGICGLSFVTDGKRQRTVKELIDRWKGAALRESPRMTQPFVDKLFFRNAERQRKPLQLFLKGTNFQVKVWEALMRIPEGSVVSYQDIARAIGNSKAGRAVGQAVGGNPIAYIIPCHRVIQQAGVIGNYHWGSARKSALLGREWATVGTISNNAA
jgi:AraC family transcriptional regulator of adaptative response/methylated-DNA-[protein]-cysteine methyltransferase